MATNAPIPQNEWERILNLSDYNIDYSSLDDSFKDLAQLAAKVAGTPISLVNLIDSYTLWTISNHGMDTQQTPREETVCQYTIMESDHFEVADMTKDDRFKDQPYVTDDPALRYYYGIPLQSDGYNLGALCVIDKIPRSLPPEKVELLRMIAQEIVARLRVYKTVESLRNKVTEAQDTRNKVAHDIRGPLAGIIGLSKIIAEQGTSLNIDEILEFINLIYKSSKSLLDLTDEILSAETKSKSLTQGNDLNLSVFKEKLEKLYTPQAMAKGVTFDVKANPTATHIVFPQNKLIQIIGNLISNAIKFTPAGGTVTASLDMKKDEMNNALMISVNDTGIGLTEEQIDTIMSGSASSTGGTEGERGFGFGLALVRHLVQKVNGTMAIISTPGQGASFTIEIPV